MNGKKTIFLAGDSTVQSYTEDKRPQMGWGQLLYKFFNNAENCKIYNRDISLGSHVVTYEMDDLIIENHSLAARSSRSFIEQGRLDNILKVAEPGDYMMVQFAHNDAYEAREERYVPVDKFGEWLKKYYDACRLKGMTCVFVTPVSMRVFDKDGHCEIAFKPYRDAMLETAKALNAPCIDLSLLSTEYIEKIGPEAARDIFLWVVPGEYPDTAFKDGNKDNAHFQEAGALKMASIVASELKKLNSTKALCELAKMLKDSFSVELIRRKLPEGFEWETEQDMQAAAKQEILNRK